MEYFLYTVELPFSKIVLRYRELNSKEQLILSKANNMLSIDDDETFLEYSLFFNKIISNCVENKDDFYKLNLIDYLLFVTKLRIVSIGNVLNLQFEKKEDEKMESKVSIDLNIFMKNLYDSALPFLSNNTIIHKDLKIILDYPNIKKEQYILNYKTNNITEHLYKTIPEFIKEVYIREDVLFFENITSDEKILFFEQLPFSIKTKIQNTIFDILNELSTKNHFEIEKMSYFKYNLYGKSFQEIIRLFFDYDLKSIYKEYYSLASRNIDPQYVDTLSISERQMYYSLLEEEIKTRNSSMSDSYGDSITNLM
jgi:hypothetical protein